MQGARRSASCVLALVVAAVRAAAQMPMNMPMTDESPLGIPQSRAGSGTSWLPDASPMHAIHDHLGGWTLMLHGVAFFQYDGQGGPRGADQAAVVNWGMLAARRPLAGGSLGVRAMLSAEPWTVGGSGYSLLLQSGESYQGAVLHDRQHPHDLFVELASVYERAVAHDLALSLYLAPAGEPALGPVAYPHRPSAASDPLAPLGHHWQDATHISYGVITAGLFTRAVKVEASWFNGREPDENRTDLDYAGRRLDSYSGRVTVNPGPHWSLAAWYGYLPSPEALYPNESLHRFGMAALHARPIGSRGQWATALIYGANAVLGSGRTLASVLVETNVDLDGVNTVFGRAEYVRKRAEDLGVTTAPPDQTYDVGAVSVGYVRELLGAGAMRLGIGARGAVSVVPPALESLYGARAPLGGAVYLRWRPGRMSP
jgi:hypothetical protein